MPEDIKAAIEVVRQLPIAQLKPSPFQPRTKVEPAQLLELAESIQQNGLQQPVVVRPLGNGFELVFGHRRTMAFSQLGLQEIDAIVRPLTDAQVRAIQLVENIQRENLKALEEADAFGKMRDLDGMTGDQIAITVGRKRSVVYNRLRLLQLSKAARAAVIAGKLDSEVAVLLAQLPPKQQDEHLPEILDEDPDDVDAISSSPMSYRQVREYLQAEWRPLKKAVFQLDDAKLVAKAGSCVVCPKRTGNDPALDEGADPDVCRDGECYRAKEEAHFVRKKNAATAAGAKLTARHHDYETKEKIRNGELVDLDRKDPSIDKKRTLREVLGDNLAGAVVTDSMHSEPIVAMAPTKLAAALKAAGIDKESRLASTAKEKSSTTPAQRAAARKVDVEQQRRRLTESRVMAALHEATKLRAPDVEDMLDITTKICPDGPDEDFESRWGFKYSWNRDDFRQTLRKAKLTPVDLARLWIELLVCESLEYGSDEDLDRVARRWGVKVDQVRKAVEAELPMPEDAAPAKKKGARK